MHPYILDFQEISSKSISLAGGKGATLGELSRIEGIRVPDGFCLSTEAFTRIIGEAPQISGLLDQLSQLTEKDPEAIRELSGELRRIIEGTAIPQDIAEAVARALAAREACQAYAVRSSATAEDLPDASFAGQQDSYLNITGQEAVLHHIRRCWASLFTERAVIYRIRNGFDHRSVRLSVIVQQMVFPQAAGILFTADPISGNRKITSVEASFGLGEALVSGLVNADTYKIREGRIIWKKISAKERAVYPLPEGGTQQQTLAPEQQRRPALTAPQLLQLERMGRTLEAHFGCPQDIEWCLADGSLYVVQSRPITTLFPIPEAGDQGNRVYVSVGHQQMMTDAMKPLGLSFFLLTTRAPMRTAGGRLFVDITRILASPAGRKTIIHALGKSDPLIRDALQTILRRKDFIPLSQDGAPSPAPRSIQPGVSWKSLGPIEQHPALVAELMERAQASLREMQQTIQTQSGEALFDYILKDLQQLQQVLFHPPSATVIAVAMDATAWLNRKMKTWLGEKNAADTLSLSVSNNVTSEMGLALLDVADAVRPYPAVIAYLQQPREATLWEDLVALEGGPETRQAIDAWLLLYGMRCPGEIDLTRTRWSENPAALIPLILSNIRTFEAGESRRKFDHGRQEALKKEQELLNRLAQLPGGARKVRETQRRITLLRNLIGYREFPKYSMISRYFVYKQALLKEARTLVQAGVIPPEEDIFYLTFDELREATRTHQLEYQRIVQRREAYQRDEKRTPPRVLTSEGEALSGAYKRRSLPAGAMPGLAVSAGVVEGRARVLLHMDSARLEAGDILVTAFTDPSWTPLFVTAAGLVTEVGGLMTHGAVIAREYGLPAVVGVAHATERIKDGQRIRVHGTEGYVEVL